MRGHAARVGLILLAATLNACALFAPQPVEPDQAAWAERQSRYAGLDQWQVRARMATGVLGWSGSLHWQQAAESLQLSVSGPLGLGGFQAAGTLAHVEVLTSDKQHLQGDPELLYREVVGWPFPLRNMRYWALGLPVPGKALQPTLDAQGRLQELQQAGWQVQYSEYRRYGDWELPRRMKLDNGDISIRIVIDDWQSLGSS